MANCEVCGEPAVAQVWGTWICQACLDRAHDRLIADIQDCFREEEAAAIFTTPGPSAGFPLSGRETQTGRN